VCSARQSWSITLTARRIKLDKSERVLLAVFGVGCSAIGIEKLLGTGAAILFVGLVAMLVALTAWLFSER
jgi:hypothetical protein